VNLRTEAFLLSDSKESLHQSQERRLSIKLSGFDVSVTPGKQAKLSSDRNDPFPFYWSALGGELANPILLIKSIKRELERKLSKAG
jgi:hypothetical protein